MRNRTRGQLGWGDPIAAWLTQPESRSATAPSAAAAAAPYLTEGLWDKVLADLKPGDFVLMQFGHNDGGPLDDAKARASLKGSGDESRVVTNKVSGKVETVHTYGWYLRKYIADAKGKGATPIVLSLVPRKIWKDGKVVRATKDYALWAAEAARAEGVAFVDLNAIVARHYEELGPEKVNGLFGDEHTHTNPEGAKLNAQCVVEGLRASKIARSPNTSRRSRAESTASPRQAGSRLSPGPAGHRVQQRARLRLRAGPDDPGGGSWRR